MNSQTTIIGPPGERIWIQDFHLLVANPRKQRLSIQVKDSFGFTDFTIGTGEVELSRYSTNTDSITNLQGGWGLFRRRPSGEILLRLTYKAYVEDEVDDGTQAISRGRSDKFTPLDSEGSSDSSGGSALFWFAVITSLAVLTSINVGGTSLFNP